LEQKWTIATDWKPITSAIAQWEPPLQGAVAGDFLYVPGFGGSVLKVDRKTGKQVKRISPFGVDTNPFGSSGLAVDAHGDLIYTLSRAHRNSRFSFLVAATHELKPKWSTSLRGLVDDGCGVTDPSVGVPNPDGGATTTGLCRAGAAQGVDPATNSQPSMRVDD